MRCVTILILVTLIGCTHTSVRDLSTDYEVIKGSLSAPPVPGNGGERIFLYIKTEEKVEDKETVLVAIAENTESKRILDDLAKLINDSPNEVVYLYGQRTKEGAYEEFVTGIDFIVVAAGVYIPQTKAYRIVITDYGERGQDALSKVSYGGFVKMIGKAAMKAL